MKLTGNTILITGGGTGIGKALAQQLYKLGNEVIICGRREHRLKEVQDECPGIHIRSCDINSAGDRKDIFEFVKEEFPKLNVLVNNGASQTDYDLKLGLDGLSRADEEISTILNAPIMLNGYFIPFLMNQPDPVIVNVTSILGFTPLTRIPIYCAAKAGFHVYTIELRKHLEDTPIKVFEVPPPRVETELNPVGRAHSKPGTEKIGLQPDEYAAFVIEKLGDDVLDIFYPPYDDMIKNQPRYETELSRLL